MSYNKGKGRETGRGEVGLRASGDSSLRGRGVPDKSLINPRAPINRGSSLRYASIRRKEKKTKDEGKDSVSEEALTTKNRLLLQGESCKRSGRGDGRGINKAQKEALRESRRDRETGKIQRACGRGRDPHRARTKSDPGCRPGADLWRCDQTLE